MSSLIVSHDSHLMMLEIAVENVSEYFLRVLMQSSILEFIIFLIREEIYCNLNYLSMRVLFNFKTI